MKTFSIDLADFTVRSDTSRADAAIDLFDGTFPVRGIEVPSEASAPREKFNGDVEIAFAAGGRFGIFCVQFLDKGVRVTAGPLCSLLADGSPVAVVGHNIDGDINDVAIFPGTPDGALDALNHGREILSEIYRGASRDELSDYPDEQVAAGILEASGSWKGFLSAVTIRPGSMKGFKQDWTLVTGRLPGDDEDSTRIFQGLSTEEAQDSFRNDLLAEDHRSSESLVARYGADIFINGVFTSSSPITQV